MTMTDDKKKALETKITDLEESLSKLKDKLYDEQIEEQHEAIDHLDEYLEEIDSRYSNLKDFWAILGKEIKELFSVQKEEDDKQDEG